MARAAQRAMEERKLLVAGGFLGFALSGFFDGILLHQILQWHHLLSGLEGEAFRDLEVQILADGFFHVLMYAIALIGLWLLWRRRISAATAGSAAPLLSGALIGFGLWHVLDAVLFHWLLGLHRIRMDSAVPLVWDLIWFVFFGLLFIAAGLRLRRSGGGPGLRSGGAVAASLILAVLVAGPLAALPPQNTSTTLVLFRSGTPATSVFAALEATNGRLLWSDPEGRLWAFDLPSNSDRSLFYRHGALLVGGGWLSAGCLEWFRA